MKKIFLLSLVTILLSFTLTNSSKIKDGEQFKVKINDSTEITIIQAINTQTNLPIYYYSNLSIPACNTGECKIIEMTMYWDIYGNYYKYSVPKGTPLTKANHKEFSKSDYIRLHLILNDTSSRLKNLAFNHLTETQADKWYKTDGNTGASIKLMDKTKIKGAIKTSHTLWHVANNKYNNKIKNATEKYFRTHTELPNLFKNDPATSTDIIKLLTDLDRFNLTQLQNLISIIETNKIELSEIKSVLKNSFNDKDMSKKILVSNYCLRNKHKSSKAIKIAKSINYFN